MRKCKDCGIEKPIDEFPKYWDKRMRKTYTRWQCQPCWSEYKRKQLIRNPASKSLYHNNKEWHKKRKRPSTMARRAHRLVHQNLEKQPCQVIGCREDQKVEAHHEDYSKPLDVIWFCSRHHHQYHAGWKLEIKEIENEQQA